jgi:hypothetical protein
MRDNLPPHKTKNTPPPQKKNSEGGMLLGRTLRASVPALVLFVFLTTILTIVFGSLIYFFEMGTFMVRGWGWGWELCVCVCVLGVGACGETLYVCVLWECASVDGGWVHATTTNQPSNQPTPPSPPPTFHPNTEHTSRPPPTHTAPSHNQPTHPLPKHSLFSPKHPHTSKTTYLSGDPLLPARRLLPAQRARNGLRNLAV